MYIVEKRLNPIEVLFPAEKPICHVVIPDVVHNELQKLSADKASKKGVIAASAIILVEQILKTNPNLFSYIKIAGTHEDIDSVLIGEARLRGYILATADREMKKRAEKMGVEVLFLRRAKGRLI
ncbi:hypothetical protein MA03_06065 [Infirmifilum uzonense]|uniref:VapC9 PIN-like domain-containing protein n=2 Tax=Thermofilaceae TaxID=114378 RepID=A0A0F7FI88_9CREN|nr:hypothetical protein MA03_06065 [Infirmifilum uzonense]